METEMKKRGARTIFLSSISRLKYSDGQLLRTHGDYPKAMREVAKQLDDPYVDLETLTYLDLAAHDPEYNAHHYLIFKPGEYENYPQGSNDTTHLCRNGASWICSLVVKELKKIPELAEIFN